MNNRLFASAQFAIGIIAIIIVVVSYVKFGVSLKASMSNSSENNSEVLRKVIDDSITASEKWLSISGSSGKCASEATLQAFAAMRNELPKINELFSAAALLSSSIEKKLPISIPSVTENTKTIKIPVPYIEEGSQMIDIPTFEVNEKEEKITYISAVTQKNEPKTIKFSLCKNPSKKTTDVKQDECKEENFEYVSKVDTTSSTYSWKNQTITPSIQHVAVQAPKISIKEQSFDIQEVKVTSQPIMGDEKKQLQLLSQQLSAMSTLQGVVDSWIQLLQKELEQCPEEKGREIIVTLQKNLRDAREKITTDQGASEEVFKAVVGIVPCLFLILGLLAAATSASGAAKLFVRRKKDDDRSFCNNDTMQQPVQHEKIASPSAHQAAMSEQSAPIEQQS